MRLGRTIGDRGLAVRVGADTVRRGFPQSSVVDVPGGPVVLVLCWSVKGGSGTTVVASSLSLVLAAQSAEGALLVDLVGDSSAVLGLPEEAPTNGVVDWLMAGDEVGADSLHALESTIGSGLTLLPVGSSSAAAIPPHRWRLLGELLAADARPVIVDCGASSPPRGLRLAASSSLIVTRLCYLALRRAAGVGDLATGVVVIKEHGRALSRRDVARIIGRPVVAEVPLDPEVARAVDAGLLAARLPHSISRPLRRVNDLAA